METQTLTKISQIELDKILAKHFLWIDSKSDQGEQANLFELDLRELNFPNGVNLSKANIIKTNLTGVSLIGANLREANLIEANLTEANLKETDFTEANLAETDFTGANLAQANLTKTNLFNTKFEKTELADAKLIEATFLFTQLPQANLQNADFKKAIFTSANLEYANLEHATFKETEFRYTQLQFANLGYSKFEKARFILSNLDNAILKFSTFNTVIIFETHFKGVDFESTTIKGTNFQTAHLDGAYLNNTKIPTPKKDIQRDIYIQKSRISKLENELQGLEKANKKEIEKESSKPIIIEYNTKNIEYIQKELQFQKQKLGILEQRDYLNDAHNSLIYSLENTEKQIMKNQIFSSDMGRIACWLILMDILILGIMPALLVHGQLDYLLDKVGMWGILFFTFPTLLILLIALSLLRHQKQLIAEIRHYSMLKHKIELYGGVLKAAQFTAFSLVQSQNLEVSEYVKSTFDEIKVELLKTPNFDVNTQPHIIPEEGGNLVEMLKSMTELVKTSTEISKTAAESVKKAVTSEK